MNYIQRLFDSAAPPMAASNMPVAPSTVANSPVMSADQRLGIFPGLVDPFSPQPAMDVPPQTQDTARAHVPAPQRRNIASDPAASQRPTNAPVIPTTHESPTSTPQNMSPHAETQLNTAPATPINPLQRLAEMDPLPSTEAGHAARQTPAETTPAMVSPLPASPHEMPVPIADASRNPAVQPTAPIPLPSAQLVIPNPTAITPDQFSPRLPDTGSAPAKPVSVQESPLPPVAHPEARPIHATPEPPEPIQPSATQAPSPFARTPDLPPPPPVQHVQSDPTKTPERIIERIQEVPVAPAPPPKPMTAAAQSVIGPLSQRRSGWQPRQGGF